MQILTFLAWNVALFFCVSWTLGVMMRKDFRLPSTLVTIGYWWLLFALAVLRAYGPLHLFWLVPAALLVPSALMHAGLRSGRAVPLIALAIKSGLVMLAPLAALLYVSR